MTIKLAVPYIQKDSIVDGEGIRSVIWTQGCPHHCPGCHNPETHDFKNGYDLEITEIIDEIDKLEGQNGITFSGGDPMMQPEACTILAKYCHKKGLNVWCYTGYKYEELIEISKKKPAILDFLKQIDVLIDGKFILSEKSYDVIFRGSKNQRIIDVQKSLEQKEPIIMSKYNNIELNKKGRKNHYMYV